MRKIPRYSFFLLATIIILTVNGLQVPAQFVTEKPLSEFVKKTKSNRDKGLLITPDSPITSLAVKISTDDSFQRSLIIHQGDTTWLTINEHAESSADQLTSNLVIFPEPVKEFTFVRGPDMQHDNDVLLYFIYAPPLKTETPVRKKKAFSEGCSAPEMIDQAMWRSGLPPPDYDRIPNQTEHTIIHHSAGSNTDTNYVNVVRNIYLYHTGVNGWSDIGYNYAIAQNGWIFEGRDPDVFPQDSVMGAHFCASNNGTMGVCVLGNYMETHVPDSAIKSLKNLLTWKLFKDTLNPLGRSPHPLNQNLNRIAGHRQGCSTLCPGDSLFLLFESLRQEVYTEMQACGYISGVEHIRMGSLEISLFPNPASGEITLESKSTRFTRIRITTIDGRTLQVHNIQRPTHKITLDVSSLPGGLYQVLVDTEKGIWQGLLHCIIAH